MIQEEDIDAIKKKNQMADNNILVGSAKDIDLDDEDNQLLDHSVMNRQYTSNNLLDEDKKAYKKAKGIDSDIEDLQEKTNSNTIKSEKFKLFDSTELLDSDGNNIISEEESRLDTKENLIGPVKSEFEELQRKILEKTRELDGLEAEFYKRVSSVSLELEGIGTEQEEELERHRHLYEMQQLMELDKRMSRVEKEKVRLLQQEQRVTSHLGFRSKVLGEELAELEQLQDIEARKRELTLTKMYARLNSRIKQQVTYAEGNLRTTSRKRTAMGAKSEEMLFDGIRDQKLRANWLKTPQPVVVKLMTARCLRDKIPKGDFIIRAGVLDRLVDNKLYYKFVEYGERVKEQRMVDREREKNNAKRETELASLRAGIAADDEDPGIMHVDQDNSDREHAEQDYQDKINAPIFDPSIIQDDNDSDGSDNDGRSKKGVTFATDVVDHQRKSVKINHQNSMVPGRGQGIVAVSMRRTKIGFDTDELKQRYRNKEHEKVWIDFGKVNSNVLRYDPVKRAEMSFNGHKLYYMLPPSLSLLPSNVIIFELVYLSSKNSLKDVVVGWGAFPIVNGEFQINTGKFKLPLLYGNVDWSTNKFKDIEKKYMRNIDEWLCNLYIQVKKVELFDFRYHEEKIEFLVPKRFQKAMEEQQKAKKALLERRQSMLEGSTSANTSGTSGEDEGSDDASANDDSDSDEDMDSDEGFEDIADIQESQKFEDDARVVHSDYKYCVSRDDNYVASDAVVRDTAIRRVQFILNEIVVDMGIAKGTYCQRLGTLTLAIFVLELRMIMHYLGQWLLLKSVDAPVTEIKWKYYEIELEYAYWTMTQQLLVVVSGPLMNTILFGFMISVCHFSQKFIYCFPVSLCKFIAWYGLATCLDFFLIAVVDMANQNPDGDLFKLYNYYQRTQNSGFIGFFLTFLVQFAMLLVNIFVFYNYIVFVHNDARIHDIYMRISGLGKGYHIPYDNEISWNYLKQTYCLGEINNNRIVVNKFRIVSSATTAEPRIAKSYQFQRFINAAAVATDEVYFATENGQILDVDYREMELFRKKPLYTLLNGVTSTIGRLGRPNNAIEFVKRQREAARDRSTSFRRSPRQGSLVENPQVSPRTGQPALQRRGTISFVKNVMIQKLQNAQQVSLDDNLLAGEQRNSDLNNIGGLPFQRNRHQNQSVHLVSGKRDISSLQGGLGGHNRNITGTDGRINQSNQNADDPLAASGLELVQEKTGAHVNLVMAPEAESDGSASED